MIVNSGKDTIKNYFGGQVAQIGDHLAFGTGTTPETVDDTALEAEVYRIPITSISADLTNNRIVFKGTIVPGYIDAGFTEIGLYYNGGSDTDAVLVSRVVLGTTQVPDASLPTDAEYSLEIAV